MRARSSFRALAKVSIALALLVSIVACSQVSVRRVPSRGDYDEEIGGWTKELQEKVDGMEGIPFYMPKTYVAVKKRFPICTKTYLISGKLTGDVFQAEIPSGSDATVIIEALRELGWVPGRGDGSDKTFGLKLSQLTPSRVPAAADARGSFAQSSASTSESSSGEAEEGDPQAPEGGDTTETENSGSSTGVAGVGLGGGDASASVTAATVDPIVKVSNYYDIVFLPDYEEKYVVGVEANLGKAEASVALRHGWLMGSGSIKENNEELAKFVFGEIQGFTQILRNAVAAKIAPETIVGDAMAGGSGTSEAQSRSVTGGGSNEEMMTVRLVVVRFANLGPHPVLKPREIEKSSAWSDGTQRLFKKTFPVKYGYSTEVYVELLGPRPIITAAPMSNTSGVNQNPRTTTRRTRPTSMPGTSVRDASVDPEAAPETASTSCNTDK